MKGSIRNKGTEKKPNYYACWWIKDPATGKRAQRSKGGFSTKKAAQAYLSERVVEVERNTYVDVNRKLTVGELLTDHWLPSKRAAGLRASTVAGYSDVIRSWILPRLGATPVAALTPAAVSAALDDMSARGGKHGKPLTARSVQLAATLLRGALDWAMAQGYATRNVAKLAPIPRVQSKVMKVWIAEEARRFAVAVRGERDGALYILATVRGLRRGELAGLRWPSVDLDAGHLSIVETRVLVAGQVEDSIPKTSAGKRRIPLDAALVTVLREHRKRQMEDRLAAGSAWHDSGHVFTDAIGVPLHPEHISDRFAVLCRRAEVPVIRFHDQRHTAATLLLALGHHPRVVQEMLGHSDVAITLNTYSHITASMGDAAGEAISSAVLG